APDLNCNSRIITALQYSYQVHILADQLREQVATLIFPNRPVENQLDLGRAIELLEIVGGGGADLLHVADVAIVAAREDQKIINGAGDGHAFRVAGELIFHS